MFGYLITAAIAYTFGAKAGHKRYRQIKSTLNVLINHPTSKSIINYGRNKLAEKISPQTKIKTIKIIEDKIINQK